MPQTSYHSLSPIPTIEATGRPATICDLVISGVSISDVYKRQVLNGLPGATIWLLADASTALPILTNTATLIVLFPVFLKLLNDYKARYMNRGKIDPDMKIFYNDKRREK